MTKPWETGPGLIAADRVVRFISKHCRHSKGPLAGQLIKIHPFWENEVIRPLFGTLKDDGNRQYTTAYIEVARKNAKTTMGAALALYALLADSEQGGEVYTAAADRDQAGISFGIAQRMVEQDQAMTQRCKIIESQKRVIVPKTGNIMRALSNEGKTKHGYNPSFVLCDEVHIWPKWDLYEALTSGSDVRRQPLIIIITTAGADEQTLCGDLHDYAMKIQTGEASDPSFFACIKTVPKDADWNDERVWYLGNPGLYHPDDNPDGWIDLEKFRNAFRQAQNNPRAENAFRILRLNQWVAQIERWLPMDDWKACGDGESPKEWRERMLEELKGEHCMGGLDLGSTSDLTAFVLWFEYEGRSVMLPWFWVPEDGDWLKGLNRPLYEAWIKDGFLETTEGEMADYEYIKNRIMQICEDYGVDEVGGDIQFQGAHLCTMLNYEGIEVLKIPQNWTHLNPASWEFEGRVKSHKIAHGNNPILTWMASFVTLQVDASGKLIRPIKPKGKPQLKIDGIVAAVMALARMLIYDLDANTSVWDDPDMELTI